MIKNAVENINIQLNVSKIKREFFFIIAFEKQTEKQKTNGKLDFFRFIKIIHPKLRTINHQQSMI